uniref:Branchpoint-bridging protein n=1 Tax=Vannella robusta TaxID=1487602 RepID=A0A7S4M4P2_9EUKA
MPRPKKSRWGTPDIRVYYSGIPAVVPNTLSALETKALMYRARIEEITQKLTTGNLDIDTSDDRSPSPPPKYDSMGKRTNTRDQRKKEILLNERQNLIQRVQRMNPGFRPPADYRPMAIRKQKKIPIPIEKFPEYNFIGLIIGPRGLTQKKMEKESGAKIAIRGKGSMKDGKGRMSGKMNPGDDEPLHVLITAETNESLKKAEEMVRKLLVPVEEGKNEHKRQQLETLARINGTLRDNLWKQGDDDSRNDSPSISCSLCGENSHPTRDCPLKGITGATSKLDQDVTSFLDEVGDSKHRRGFTEEELDTREHQEALEELLCIISGKPYQAPAYGNQWGQPPGAYGAPPPGGPSPYGPPAGNPSPYGPPSSAWPPTY